MTLAIEKTNSVNERLRKQLQTLGFRCTDATIARTMRVSESDCLRRLTQACLQEKIPLPDKYSNSVDTFIKELKWFWQNTSDDSVLYSWTTWIHELQESIYNQSLALLYRQYWEKRLVFQIQPAHTVWSWAINVLSPQERLEFFEQWGSTGHPYHPNFKAKIGMSGEEVAQYSPEFQPRINLQWYALQKEFAATHAMHDSYQSVLMRVFASTMREWESALESMGYNANKFYPIPVHPWQQRHKLPEFFSELLSSKKLILVNHCRQASKPSMSFRTMMTGQGIHVKLPVAVHTTSALRTVSPASVHNGPQLSRCLNNILAKHHYFQDSMYLIADLAGMYAGTPHALAEAKHLSTIIRQNPIDFLDSDETAVPFASLFTTSPISQHPLFIEIMSAAQMPYERYFQMGVHLLLKGQLHLFMQYGIALESHQQNTIMVFKHHRPVKILNRDLGGIRICTKKLEEEGYSLNLYPDSIIESTDITAVRNKFIHANLQSTIGYWINLITEHSSISSQHLWRIVKQELQSLFNDLSHKVDSDFLVEQKQAILTNPWQHKCLMRMRLQQYGDYILTPIDNPMSNL